MRAFKALLTILLLSAVAFGDSPESDEDKKGEKSTTSVWMQRKMTYAQEILRGLASADYEAIGTNARQMRRLNKIEGFVRSRQANYRIQLERFESVCDEMILHAGEKNLAGVTLAFNQMTVSCVGCHETMRASSGNEGDKPLQSNIDSRTEVE